MKNETRKGFETIGEAAARLLAGLERRAKKAVEANSSTTIHSPGGPSSGEEGAGRLEGLQRPAPVIAAGREDERSELRIPANSNSRPIFRGSFQIMENGDGNGLPDREDGVSTDRAIALPACGK